MPNEDFIKKVNDPVSFWSGLTPAQVFALQSVSPKVVGPWTEYYEGYYIRTEPNKYIRAAVRRHVHDDGQPDWFSGEVKPCGYYEYESLESAMKACDHMLRTGDYLLVDGR